MKYLFKNRPHKNLLGNYNVRKEIGTAIEVRVIEHLQQEAIIELYGFEYQKNNQELIEKVREVIKLVPENEMQVLARELNKEGLLKCEINSIEDFIEKVMRVKFFDFLAYANDKCYLDAKSGPSIEAVSFKVNKLLAKYVNAGYIMPSERKIPAGDPNKLINNPHKWRFIKVNDCKIGQLTSSDFGSGDPYYEITNPSIDYENF